MNNTYKIILCVLCVCFFSTQSFSTEEEFEIERLSIHGGVVSVQVDGQRYPLESLKVSWENKPENYFSKKCISGSINIEGTSYEIGPISLPKLYPHTLLNENKMEGLMEDGWFRTSWCQELKRPDEEVYIRETYYDKKNLFEDIQGIVTYECHGITEKYNRLHKVTRVTSKDIQKYVLRRSSGGTQERTHLSTKQIIIEELKMLRKICVVCQNQ